MQAKSKWFKDVKRAKEIINENVETHLGMMDALPFGAAPLGDYPKIVLYPEFSLQGASSLEGGGQGKEARRLEWLREAAVEIPGDETDAFGKKSVEKDCYIQGCVWDRDTKFGKDVFFESVFITDPKGKVVYVRRRTILGIPGVSTTPDLYDEYVKKYGPDPVNALFPVLKTPLGVLGGIMCCEMSTPEISRALSMNGAEILLHSTSEPHIHNDTAIQGHHFRDMQRPVRASDNCIYLASANIGITTTADVPLPLNRDRGCSEILDWRGNRLARIEGPGEAIATAPIDIEALRRVRRKWLFGRLPSRAFVAGYQKELWPINGGLILDDAQNKKTREEALKRILQSGAIQA